VLTLRIDWDGALDATGAGIRENSPPKWRRRPRWTRCWRGARGWVGAAARWKGAPGASFPAPRRGAGGGVEGAEGASVARFRVNFRRCFGDFPDALLRLCPTTASQRLPRCPRAAQGFDACMLGLDPAPRSAHPPRRIRAVPGHPSKKANAIPRPQQQAIYGVPQATFVGQGMQPGAESSETFTATRGIQTRRWWALGKTRTVRLCIQTAWCTDFRMATQSNSVCGCGQCWR
jgi:hypothetical protein